MVHERLYLVTERVNDLTAFGCRTNHDIEYLMEEKRSVKCSRQTCELDHQRVSCCTKNNGTGYNIESGKNSSTYSSPSRPSQHHPLFGLMTESTIMTATPVDTLYSPLKVLDFHCCHPFSHRFLKYDGDYDHHHFCSERFDLGERDLEAINNTNNNNNLSKLCSSITSSMDDDSTSPSSFKERRKRRILDGDSNNDQIFVKRAERRFKYDNVSFLNVIFAVTIIGLQLMSNVKCYPSSSDPCKFPSEWVGKWFQKGIPEAIRITSNEMSEKGVCRETSGDKFLIESRSERCVRCIVMNQKHSNVLQYKETFCFPNPRNNPRRLRDVCSEINGDASLYSLFRLDTPTIPCPFTGPFKFSYSRGHGECQEPMSSIESCVDTTRLLFRFQACADIIGSESRNEELSCYGEWKEGSTRYLVGKMSHRITRTDEDKFRCFVFERRNHGSSGDEETSVIEPVNEGYLLAQSGDATCDGLSSVYEGSRTMKLSQSSPVIGSCDFPFEVTSSKYWKYLDEIYDFSKNSSLRVYNSTTAEILRTITCIRREARTSDPSDGDSLESSSFTEFVVHSVSGCDIGFMCLRIHKRENQVVEIEESTLSRGGDSFSEGGCSYQRFNKNYLTLFVIRQSSSSSSSSSSISSSSNDDLNKISDRDNPSSSSLDPALHSNPSASSAPSFSSVNIKYLASLISLVISQRMMSVNFW